jgi:hypothetical protein
MFERFAKALKVAVRNEGFVQILGPGVLLVVVGTLTILIGPPAMTSFGSVKPSGPRRIRGSNGRVSVQARARGRRSC